MTCCRRDLLSQKSVPQSSQVNARLLVWRRACVARMSFRANALPHSSHWKGAVPSTSTSTTQHCQGVSRLLGTVMHDVTHIQHTSESARESERAMEGLARFVLDASGSRKVPAGVKSYVELDPCLVLGVKHCVGSSVARHLTVTWPSNKHQVLDHLADVQLHAWGANLQEAYEQAATAKFGYMTEIDTVEMTRVQEVEAETNDLQGFLFHFFNEFVFSCNLFFIARKVVITGGDSDGGDGVMKVCARLYGEEFQLAKHPQGTEVKAITYASMQVYDELDQHEVFVIVDIRVCVCVWRGGLVKLG
ncbi:LOW QUALITY PROTEIN: uncharacterized protein LOC135092620 [Scylla paramamosain]|uniref:LOW QUALITY PROTEIN: uncharacterized protein LOC135092620 n=1 Tax=Scylla paramamosain TaxID=85552 RepID=UPI003082BB8E